MSDGLRDFFFVILFNVMVFLKDILFNLIVGVGGDFTTCGVSCSTTARQDAQLFDSSSHPSFFFSFSCPLKPRLSLLLCSRWHCISFHDLFLKKERSRGCDRKYSIDSLKGGGKERAIGSSSSLQSSSKHMVTRSQSWPVALGRRKKKLAQVRRPIHTSLTNKRIDTGRVCCRF